MNFGDKGGMTVRITFKKSGKEWTMLFGNSYKHWYTQATEYVYRNHGSETEGWGGLKWCSEDLMQEELNREGVQQSEPDNLDPRKYTDFVFSPYSYGYRRLMKELKEY